MTPLPRFLAGAAEPERPRLRKRERTRLALIDAAVRVFSSRGFAAATMQEIAAEAGMTTGTLYNHFDAKADIVAAVAIAIAQTMQERSSARRDSLSRGVERVAMGCQHYLWLAKQSPDWALMLLDVAAATPAFLETVGAYVRADVRRGVRQKEIEIESETAALDLVCGSVMQGMRSIALGLAPPRHGTAITAMVLRGLGVPAEPARKIARKVLATVPGGDAGYRRGR
ncbi:MAG: TetR/AcrR family transcriptional regulator [Proteobacteria bacterium]|nr:TetR/AcrR family transcriptional regulator [Pseudomonadota bacterium]